MKNCSDIWGSTVFQVFGSTSYRSGSSLGSLHLYCRSEPMKAVRKKLQIYGAVDFPVLIQGERGVDKEGAARLVHTLGRRENVEVYRCFKGVKKAVDVLKAGAIPGIWELLENPSGGTLVFLDIDQLRASSQLALLDYLTDRDENGCGKFRWRVIGTSVGGNLNLHKDRQLENVIFFLLLFSSKKLDLKKFLLSSFLIFFPFIFFL